MAAVGDTVLPRFFVGGEFLRRPLIFGTVVSGGGGGATQVLWADGRVVGLDSDAELVVTTGPAVTTAALLGKFARTGTFKGTAQRNEGVVVAAFEAGGDQIVVVETVLGLLAFAKTSEITIIPAR